MKRLAPLFWFLFSLTTPLWAAERVVSVATLDDDAPYVFPKSNAPDAQHELIPPGVDSARLQGYSWDVFRESLHAMGYTIDLRIYPWARVMHQGKTGAVDVIFPTGFNEERQAYLNFSSQHINRVDFVVYVRKDSQLRWAGLESLNGLKIGEMRGWNYGEAWKNNTKILKFQVGKILNGFHLVDKKRLDGFVGYELSFESALIRAGLLSEFKKLPSFGYSLEYVAGTKNNPRTQQILNDFDQGKQKILKTGIMATIANKWQLYY